MYKEISLINDKIIVSNSDGEIVIQDYEEGIEELYLKENELEIANETYEDSNNQISILKTNIEDYKKNQFGHSCIMLISLFLLINSIFLGYAKIAPIFAVVFSSGIFLFCYERLMHIKFLSLYDRLTKNNEKIIECKENLEKRVELLNSKYCHQKSENIKIEFEDILDYEDLKDLINDYRNGVDIEEKIATLKSQKEELIRLREKAVKKNTSHEKVKSLTFKKKSK